MRNVILVTIDSLRADHTGPYADVSTTPELDRLASNGVVYEHPVVPGPSTPQSMPAIWTGQYPLMTDTEEDRTEIRRHLMTHETIAELFTAMGYATAAFTPNPFTSRSYGFDVGFDHFEDLMGDGNRIERLRSWIIRRWMETGSVGGARFALNMLGLGDISWTWESYYEEIISWLDRVDEPWFLWLFLLEPHWPYRPPSRHRTTSWVEMYRANWRRAPATSHTDLSDTREVLVDLYNGAIRHVDELIGNLQADLADPAIVVHGDHGEAFGEHDVWGHGSTGFGAPLYDEHIRVPLVVGNTDPDIVPQPVSLRRLPDILMTAATGKGNWRKSSRPWVIAKSDAAVAIRGRRWKYIRADQETRTYDLAVDPNERNPLTGSNPLETIGDMLVNGCHQHRIERTRIRNSSESFQEPPDRER